MFPNCNTVSRVVEVSGWSRGELLDKLQQRSISMNQLGEELFQQITLTEDPYSVETTELTVRDLGFPRGETSAALFQRAKEVGLELCPPQIGPYLRLQYLDQPEGKWLIVASQKLSDRPEFPNGFYLRRLPDGLWLRGYTAAPEHIWGADDPFVFLHAN